MTSIENRLDGRTPKVVFVDDDIEIMGSTISMIRELGVELITTNSVSKAMDIIKGDETVDGLITDIMMDPGTLPHGISTDTNSGLLTGLRFAEFVKSEIPEMPIIGISAAAMPVDDIGDSPFDDFVSKASMLGERKLWSRIHEHFLARHLKRSNDWVRDSISESDLLIYEAKPDLLRNDRKEFHEQRQQILVSVNENLLRGPMDNPTQFQ